MGLGEWLALWRNEHLRVYKVAICLRVAGSLCQAGIILRLLVRVLEEIRRIIYYLGCTYVSVYPDKDETSSR